MNVVGYERAGRRHPRSRRQVKRYVVSYERADGRELTFRVQPELAFAVARGLAKERVYGRVTLHGYYALLTFQPDGSFTMTWNEYSDAPGVTEEHDARTTVCGI